MKLSNPALPRNPRVLMFICKGNICRSAYAHYYCAKQLSGNKNINTISVNSTGLFAKDKASPQIAITAAEARGVDMEHHIPTPINKKAVKEADMVLVVEPKQVAILRERYPKYANKYFLLAFFENESQRKYSGWYRYHIEDPYGQGLEQFTQCFERIERCVDGLIASIDKQS